MDRAGTDGRSDAGGAGRPRRRGRRALAVGLGTALVAGGGLVAVDLAGAPGAAAASLEPFGSCEELTTWYREATLPQVTAYGLQGHGRAMPATAEAMDDSAGGGAAPAAGADTSAAVGSSDTGTNVQEAGVDEPARIKTRDGLAYLLSGDRLVVVDLAAGRVRGELDLDPTSSPGGEGGDEAYPRQQRWFGELLLVGDRVVVLGSGSLPAPAAPGEDAVAPGGMVGGDALVPWWGPPTTTATTVDVADPAAPVLVDEVEIEGGYVSARATGGHVRLVTTSTPFLPFVDPWLQPGGGPVLEDAAVAGGAEEGGAEEGGVSADDPMVGAAPTAPDESAALDRNRQVVTEATTADWLPDLVERDADGTVAGREPVACETVAHPPEQAGAGTVSVLTLDPSAADTLAGTTSVSADGSMVYASPERLYVATTTGGWAWDGWGADEVRTDLHGFDTSQGGRTSYLGSGSVDGWLLGPWAMDAHDGHLRVGTTTRDADGTEDTAGEDGSLTRPALPAGGTSSSVVVLAESGGGLDEVGRVDGLGPGEQIRGLRWFDDLAVVITFEQTDPLYTVDLADPAEPRLLGELKVLGYSAYLHPVGEDLLLGVGQDGTPDGRLLGTKVETYDLSDLAAPTDVASYVWPETSSPVEWDSRQFAYLPERRTAVLPLERYTEESYGSGLVAVEVGTDGAVRESGSWAGGEGGFVSALATTAEEVLVTQDRWTEGDDRPTTVLVVLSADGLTELVEVPLG